MKPIPARGHRSLVALLALLVTACSEARMTWQGGASDDAARDEATCRAAARQEAIHRLPYGDGPPLYGFSSHWSMLSWRQEIDNERYYLEGELTRACMRNRGYRMVPATRP